jgi:hypothetical protein
LDPCPWFYDKLIEGYFTDFRDPEYKKKLSSSSRTFCACSSENAFFILPKTRIASTFENITTVLMEFSWPVTRAVTDVSEKFLFVHRP